MAAFPSVRSTLPYLVGVAIAACRRRNNERQLRLVPSLGIPKVLPVESERVPAAKAADKGEDWRAGVP